LPLAYIASVSGGTGIRARVLGIVLLPEVREEAEIVADELTCPPHIALRHSDDVVWVSANLEDNLAFRSAFDHVHVRLVATFVARVHDDTKPLKLHTRHLSMITYAV
jgi:hypothetical protein